MIRSTVDHYLAEGCGRCNLYQTPACKVHTWAKELEELRDIIGHCDLVEEIKWGVPCYTYNGSNVLILSAFKEYCSISFFKGVLLKDSQKILVAPGKNAQASRLLKYTNVHLIVSQKDSIKAYIEEAIELEKSGKKVELKKELEPMPKELIETLDNNSDLKAVFKSLTPGRQRGYILYFSQPKQAKTRISRIEKYSDHILAGKGFHDK